MQDEPILKDLVATLVIVLQRSVLQHNSRLQRNATSTRSFPQAEMVGFEVSDHEQISIMNGQA
jgi:hypothetical protein